MNFAGNRHWFFLVSLLVIVPGIVALILLGLRPGIDFTGGSSLTLGFSGVVEQQELRNELTQLGHPDSSVQNLGDNQYFVRTKLLSDDARDALIEGLEVSKAVVPNDVTLLGFDLVSPVIASETVRNGLFAVLAASVGIFIYLWWAFRSVPSPFRYGVAAIVALVHDAVIVIGVFAILGEIMGIEINMMFLIAVLTVIGYSVNDTIVVFDRLRENIMTYPNRDFEDVVNISISETLSRSINTSLTLLLTLLALFLFGGATIRSFLLVLLIGVVAGTYSSIGVATQVLVAWEKRDLGRLYRKIRPAPAATPTTN